jgi:hypothetical protein
LYLREPRGRLSIQAGRGSVGGSAENGCGRVGVRFFGRRPGWSVERAADSLEGAAKNEKRMTNSR